MRIHKRKLQSLSNALIIFFNLVFGERFIRVSITTCSMQLMQPAKQAVNTLEMRTSYLNYM